MRYPPRFFQGFNQRRAGKGGDGCGDGCGHGLFYSILIPDKKFTELFPSPKGGGGPRSGTEEVNYRQS